MRVLIPLILAFGCGSVEVNSHHAALDGGAPPSAGGEPASRAELVDACVRYVRAQDGRREACFKGFGADLSAAQACPDFLFAPGSTRTVEGTLRCAEAFQSWPCEDLQANRLPDCVSPGTRKEGESCIFASQCASGICTERGNTCGLCVRDLSSLPQPYKELKDGQPCAITNAPCEHFCKLDASGTTGVCAPLAKIGETCGDQGNNYIPCEDSYCDKNTQVCTALPISGEPCGIDPFDEANCEFGLRCIDRVCAPYGKVGEPCEPKDVSNVQCEGFAQCACAGDDCAQYVCNAIRFLDEPCSAPNTVCAQGSACTDGFCKAPDTTPLYDRLCGASPGSDAGL